MFTLSENVRKGKYKNESNSYGIFLYIRDHTVKNIPFPEITSFSTLHRNPNCKQEHHKHKVMPHKQLTAQTLYGTPYLWFRKQQ